LGGRTLAIGDVHGCDVALSQLLEMLAPTNNDTVVVLGDIVDRGPGSRQVIETLIELAGSCHLVFLLGNHEEMMLDAIQAGADDSSWLMFGGGNTLDSYGGLVENIPREHLDFLTSGKDWWETDADILVHAGVDPDLPLQSQTGHALRWQHLTGFERPHQSGKRVICGHTPLQSGAPWVGPGWVGIDTFCCGGLYLTGLDLRSELVYQASQSGHTRQGLTLDELS